MPPKYLSYLSRAEKLSIHPFPQNTLVRDIALVLLVIRRVAVPHSSSPDKLGNEHVCDMILSDSQVLRPTGRIVQPPPLLANELGVRDYPGEGHVLVVDGDAPL